MNRSIAVFFGTFLVAASAVLSPRRCSAAAATTAPAVDVWTVDPLVKVLRTAPSAEAREGSADSARGETATFQIVVRSEGAIHGLRCEAGAFKGAAGAAAGRTIDGAVVRFVGYVPVVKLIGKPPKDAIGTTRGDYPDPLLEQRQIDVKAGDAQPIWVTVKVPLDAEPGTYQASAKVIAESDAVADVPLTLHVYAAKVERTRLWVTNWFQRDIGFAPMPKRNTPEFWEMLRAYARDMAAHRQNVARTVPLELAQYTYDASGRLSVDFSRMDRWIRVFIDAGVIGRIEGQQFGWRKGKWKSPYVVSTYLVQDGKTVEKRVAPTSDEAIRFYSQFLPALQEHLEQRGWLDIWTQHLADEPVDANVESYLQIRDLVKKYAPRIRTMEALLTRKAAPHVDLMIPILDQWHHGFEYYRGLQKSGKELWFYTSWAPEGEYANRTIQLPLIKTRLLPWIGFRFGATGFLHWGYNFWPRDPDPQKVIERAWGTGRPDAVAGDAWVVYPKRHGGPGVIDSIRWEAQRDGCDDHELLSQLAQRDPAAAQRLAARHVRDFNAYDTDLATFRQTRRELLQRLSR
jgi:hypothetical protein